MKEITNMTKMQMIDKYFELMQSTETKSTGELLDKLYFEDDKITSGCHYLYSTYDNPNYQWFSTLLSNAADSKGFIRYIKRHSVWEINYHLQKLIADIEKATQFAKEQDATPFDQSQKQLAIQNGTIKSL